MRFLRDLWHRVGGRLAAGASLATGAAWHLDAPEWCVGCAVAFTAMMWYLSGE